MTGGLDVVVVSYRSPSDLVQFCESLAAFPPAGPWSFTIVNVAPMSADVEAATKGAQLVEQGGIVLGDPENIGYGKACNWAASFGHMDVIAFFNADVVLTEGALDNCRDALLSQPSWGVLGPRSVDESGRFTHAGIFGPDHAPAHFEWMQADRGQASAVREDAYSVSGSAYFVRRQLWTVLTSCLVTKDFQDGTPGAFLPTPHYYEESWCSVHARAHGWRVVYFGPVRIIHKFHKASEIGGWADQQQPASHEIFRAACKAHGISHD
jgi:GT2 family glycosyltransferase